MLEDRTKRWLFYLILLLCGLALVRLEHWPVVGQDFLSLWLQHLLEGFGEALAIAAILAAVVDEAAKRDLLKEFTETISAHIVGRLLQPVLREHIEQYLKADFVRTFWNITYTIRDVEGYPQHKKLVTSAKYEIENRSSSSKVYSCAYDLEKSLFPNVGLAKILRVKGGPNLTNGNVTFDRVNGNSDFHTFETEDSIRFNEDIWIPGGDKCQFCAESDEFLSEGSIVPCFAKHLVLATTLTVKYPVDRMMLFVDLSLGVTPEPLLVAGGKQWEFKEPLMPGQGFTVRFGTKPVKQIEDPDTK